MQTIDRHLPTQSINELCRLRSRVIPKCGAIYHQGDRFEGFYRVNSGVVMVFRLLEDSSRQISGFYTAGELFGMSGDETHPDSAITVTTANVAKLTMQDVRQSQELQSLLFKSTCNHLNAAHDLITTLTKKSAEQKVAAFLLKLAANEGEANEAEVSLPMSRQDIADYLGMSIETVSRRLTAFKEAGLLSLPNRRQANIKSVSRLKELAGALS